MPAVTDLTWTQLNDALRQMYPTTSNVITLDAYGLPQSINISVITEVTQTGVTSNPSGVIKFMAKMHEACRIAQETANTGQPTGERLAAFPAPTTTSPSGTFVPITRTIVARHDLSSATKIVGANV